MKKMINSIKLSRSIDLLFEDTMSKIVFHKCTNDSDCILGVYNNNVVIILKTRIYKDNSSYSSHFSYELFDNTINKRTSSLEQTQLIRDIINKLFKINIIGISLMFDEQMRKYNNTIGGRKYKIMK